MFVVAFFFSVFRACYHAMQTFKKFQVYSGDSWRQGCIVRHHVAAVGIRTQPSILFRYVATVHPVDRTARPRMAFHLFRRLVPDSLLSQQTVAQETNSARQPRRKTKLNTCDRSKSTISKRHSDISKCMATPQVDCYFTNVEENENLCRCL